MHLLELHFQNARENGDGRLCLEAKDNRISKWTIVPAGPGGLELLRMVTVACGGVRLFSRIPFALRRLRRRPERSLQLEVLLALHPQYASQTQDTGLWGSGVCLDQEGVLRTLIASEYRFLAGSAPRHRAKSGLGGSWLFLLGYGSEPIPHEGTDDFEFSDPFFRLTRFHSLFLTGAALTDPVEFLTRLHYRAIGWQRLGAGHALERLARLVALHFDLDTRSWLATTCDFSREWLKLAPWHRRALLPALDTARHLLDAYPKQRTPLDLPGLILFDRPDHWCPEAHLPRWTLFMDELFPQMQILATVADQPARSFPSELRARSLALPKVIEQPKRPSPVPQKAILLLDVDSRIPNLALMKLSRHFKEQGRPVILARREQYSRKFDRVCASAVFFRSSTESRIERLRKYYGDSIWIGGSGADVEKRLPAEIENLPADYSLYPELGDRAIGFLTRGCPFSCPFCIVPRKEGRPTQVATLDDLLPNGQRKLILLDDNILAHPQAGELLEEMVARGLLVNFTQTLDLPLFDEEKIHLIKRLHCSNLRFTRRVVHFSLNDSRNLEEVRRIYERFGFARTDNVEFVCMYGFNTTLAEDVERFRFLRSLPGAYVFVQEYMPIPGGPPPNLANFFDHRADDLLDELIRILFPQNMKSLEKYYRWVCRHYALTFGRIHQGLVDTIFRYNRREFKGFYVETLAGLCREKVRG